ncbi:MAG: hypothetical protein SGBAC_005257 [Bacillariaceae sp.]
MPSRVLFVSVLVLLNASLCIAGGGGEMPYFLINTPRPYCIQVHAPEETTLRVYYDAPDIDKKVVGNEKQYAPTYLTISYNAHTVGPPNKGTSLQNHKPSSTELISNTGKVDFQVHPRHREDEDVGELQVCIRASKAGTKHPMRFGLFVEEVDMEDVDAEVDVTSHLTFLEGQLAHYERKMHVMLKTADMVREFDAKYHQKTDAMNQATIFWPVVHVGILLITGFTQAQHIVNFFQKRRII